MYCKVAYCRFNHSHVVMGHKCGRCGQYGHGDAECCMGPMAVQKVKELYANDVMPLDKQCTVADCHYKQLHSIDAHHCPQCKNRTTHTIADCPKSQEIQTYHIKCPMCRTDNTVSIAKNKKITGLSDTCCICMENNVEVLLPECFHCCVCLDCLKKF